MGATPDIKIFAEHGGSYFVHADYLEAPDLSSALEEKGFDVLRTEDLTYQSLVTDSQFSEIARFAMNGWRTFTDERQIMSGKSRWYVFMARDGGTRQTQHRFLLQIFGEAHWVYENVFLNRRQAPLGILLQDHGMGGGWTRFGGQSQLFHQAQSALPRWLAVGDNTDVWPGYSPSLEFHAGQGGQHDVTRTLYRRNSEHS